MQNYTLFVQKVGLKILKLIYIFVPMNNDIIPITLSLNKEQYTELERLRKLAGCLTIQEYIRRVLSNLINEKNENKKES